MESGKVETLNSYGSKVIAGQTNNLPHLFQSSSIRETVPWRTEEKIKTMTLEPPNCPERETILIVEDEPALNELIAFHLKGKGYQILTAFDGEEALKHIQYKPDLIILDILIPEPDGWDICRAIRKSHNKEIQKIPIIILSALGEEDHRIQGLHLGADDYITKPFSIQELLLRVEKLLQMNREYRRLQSGISSLTVSQEERNLYIRDLIHDLKNSFLAFQGLTEILGRKKLNPQNREEIQNAVRESRQSVEKLLAQLWSVSKENCLNQTESDSSNLREIIENIIARYQPLASEKGVLLSCQIFSCPSASLSGQMQRLGRAIENIIDNAIKYTGKGGQVLIQVARGNSKEKETNGILDANDEFRITVSDTGIGFHRDRLDEVMEGLELPSTSLQSFGHGLSFSKRVIEEAGGEILIESEPGKGTKVTIIFSLAQTAQSLLPES